MRFKHQKLFSSLAAATLLTAGVAGAAHADDDVATVERNTQWQKECSACHVAFPPRLLSRESWQAVMSGLGKHFGSDASLEPDVAEEISLFLSRNAGRKSQDASGKPLLRITETRWFKREHDEVSARTWSNPKVKSPANCGACHTKADSGNYSERNIHIPR